MKVIRSNCRVQFTADDIEFILNVLRPRVTSADCLVQLLTDEDSRDLILDDESLLRAVLERGQCLRISTHFYFYILVRHTFRRSGLNDRGMADYVAEILAEFSHAERMRMPIAGANRPMDYFFEMLAALQTADDVTRFHIRAHIGNYSLFLSGVFPDRVRSRAERRGFPDLRYYEELGRVNFRAASDHRLARKYELNDIFQTLAERFQATRRALNDLSDRLLHLSEADAAAANVLQSSFQAGM